ncbi:type II toxin-antitoxin system YhaV family toxin [Serratia aquatilis]|uniref:Type II toxin-antitoxin system YhaV family toxin n=1 Tax=Serratia aquatilis TaxID=1737515 RepID=A0ABV6EHH9_9GAMM
METLVINGWKVFFHLCFLQQLVELTVTVGKLKEADPDGYKRKAPTKLLAAINRVIEERISANPLDPQFRLGNTLSTDHKHWFRAKFLQQFRLFFRCSERSKVIVIGWVNDFDTLRTYGSKTDVYKVFAAKLAAGDPPDDWNTLFSEAQAATKLMVPGSLPGFLSP